MNDHRGSSDSLLRDGGDIRQRIARLFLPYWRQQLIVLLCVVAASIIGLTRGFATANIIDVVIPTRNIKLLAIDIGAILAAQLVRSGIWVVQAYFNAEVGNGIMRDIRTGLVSHLHRLPISFFAFSKTGSVMNRVSNDVDSLQEVLTGTVLQFITNGVNILTTLVAMSIWNWRFTLVSIGVLGIMLVRVGSIGRKMQSINAATRRHRDEIEGVTQETLSVSGVATIKSFVREAHEGARFQSLGTRLMQLETSLGMIAQWFLASLELVFVLGIAVLWLSGSLDAIFYGLQIGVIVAFVGFVETRLYVPAQALASLQVQMVSAIATFARIFQYLDLPTEEYESDNAIELRSVRGTVRFEDVCFSYPTSAEFISDGQCSEGRPILTNISFEIRAGSTAGLVGFSGAGKSTITHLILRFYAPNAGRILIDGKDIRDVTLTSLRSTIGVLSQETYLFHDTIASNLRYAKPDASDEQLHEASISAGLHEAVTSLHDGYQTVVGERGYKLSGGERQRVAIARMMLKNPPILILDEATSALDSYTEERVQSGLKACMAGRTTLVISHRLSSVRDADVIFVLNDGRITESGTHEGLVATDGIYASLHEIQSKIAHS